MMPATGPCWWKKQYWFRWWLSFIRQQDITWIYVDQTLCWLHYSIQNSISKQIYCCTNLYAHIASRSCLHWMLSFNQPNEQVRSSIEGKWYDHYNKKEGVLRSCHSCLSTQLLRYIVCAKFCCDLYKTNAIPMEVHNHISCTNLSKW